MCLGPPVSLQLLSMKGVRQWKAWWQVSVPGALRRGLPVFPFTQKPQLCSK